MRVIHIIIGLNKGGAEGALLRLVETSSRKNIKNKVISLTTKGKLTEHFEKIDCEVSCLGLNSFLSLPQAFFKLLKEIKSYNPDIVQTWMYHADFLGGIAARILGYRNIIWNIRTTDISYNNSYFTDLIRFFCSRMSSFVPSKIVFVAHKGMVFHNKIGYSKNKSIVISNGYKFQNYQLDSSIRNQARKSLSITDDTSIIGFVGRHHPVKGINTFIKSASIVAKKNSNVNFMMVGRGNTNKNNELVRILKKEGVLNKFILLGESEDIKKQLMMMDIFILCSKTEGFPNALAEAMLMQLPCIATNVGDAPLILEDVGKIVEDDNESNLAKAIIDLLKINKSDRREMGIVSRDRIVKRYSIENFTNGYLKIYQETKEI